MRWSVFLALVLTLQISDGYKILVVYPLPGKSHAILGDGYVRHLLNAGHEVTYITPFPKKNPHTNLTQIDVSDNIKGLPTELLSIKSIMDKTVDFGDTDTMLRVTTDFAQMTITNENVQKLINDPNQQFDVVINDWLFCELYASFSAIFNCPFIWASPVDPFWMVLRLIDESPNSAYNSDIDTNNVPPFTFVQRAYELWLQLSKTFKKITIFDKIEQDNYNKHVAPVIAKKGRPVPSFEEVKFNASLVIANTHISIGQSWRFPQSVVAVGGYHIDENVEPLPKDLQQIMDDSKDGVIYFSMGTNLKSSQIPEEIKQGFLKMFGGLKQTVLWKFEEDLPGAPKNLHIMNWAPQPSILSHPNCILFITHGGLLSTTETIHYGVPIIGIPVFADQFINVGRAVLKGFAQKVDLGYDMVDKLKVAIDEVIGNPRYKEKAKELSQIYHDRPVPPGRLLVHSVEHVVKTRGAPHLRSPALMVPWYQKMYLDLLALIVVVVIIVKRMFKVLFRLCISNRKTEKQKTK